MRRAARTDSNHAEVVDALRRCGASVQSLASVGGGVPDLLVGFRGHTLLIEIKDGQKPPSERALTPDQVAWHSGWRGAQVWVITDVSEATAALGGVNAGA